MKIRCRLSGIEFDTSGAFKHIRAVSAHPLMTLSKHDLLPIYDIWKEGNLNREETILLFVALLNSTNLFSFNVPARPAFPLCLLHMEKVAKHVFFMDTIGLPEKVYPGYSINRDNFTLENIFVLLQRWDIAKENWYDKFKNAALREKLEHLEAQLAKSLRSSMKKDPRFLDKLAKWTMDATKAPLDKRKEWISLYKIEGLALFEKGVKEKLVELYEYVDLQLAEGWSQQSGYYGKLSKGHLQKLLFLVEKGIGYSLDRRLNEDGELEDISIEEAIEQESDGWMLIDEVEESNVKIAASEAPLVEPDKKNFDLNTLKGRVAFASSKSAWNAAERLRMEQVERDGKEKKDELNSKRFSFLSDEE